MNNIQRGLCLAKLQFVRHTLAVIPVSAMTQRISISSDDKLVFIADQTKPQLAVIDTATNKAKTWVRLPSLRYSTAATPDGHSLLVAVPSANQVAVVALGQKTRPCPEPEIIALRTLMINQAREVFC